MIIWKKKISLNIRKIEEMNSIKKATGKMQANIIQKDYWQ